MRTFVSLIVSSIYISRLYMSRKVSPAVQFALHSMLNLGIGISFTFSDIEKTRDTGLAKNGKKISRITSELGIYSIL